MQIPNQIRDFIQKPIRKESGFMQKPIRKESRFMQIPNQIRKESGFMYVKDNLIPFKSSQGYTKVDNFIRDNIHFLDLTYMDLKLFDLIHLVIEGYNKPYAVISSNKIAEYYDVSLRIVKYSIKNLIQKNIIKVIKKGVGITPSAYIINTNFNEWKIINKPNNKLSIINEIIKDSSATNCTASGENNNASSATNCTASGATDSTTSFYIYKENKRKNNNKENYTSYNKRKKGDDKNMALIKKESSVQKVSEKKKYFDCIYLKEDEVKKLIARFSKDVVVDCAENFNNWKMAKGKSEDYKSDYHALLNWIKKEQKQNNNKPKTFTEIKNEKAKAVIEEFLNG